MDAWPDRDIAALAAQQATMVSHAQLLKLDVGARAIERAVTRGRLDRVHKGVYSLVPAHGRPPLADEWAALLACGPGAVLSHVSAARLHGFKVAGTAVVELTVVGDRGRRRPGLRVHRAVHLERADRTRIGRLPVTTIPRTVVDLSPRLRGRGLEHLCDQALRRTSHAALMAALERRAGQPGTARLRAILDPARPSSETWSAAEERLLALIRRAGLPAPEVNVALGDRIPDLMWRRQRVIVEYDSRDWHAGPDAFHDDRDRHNALVADGWQVIHVTWRQLSERPEQVLAWIAAALARASG